MVSSYNSGTILEAAFVDPAYSYPPAEGQGRHAIELQATSHLLNKVDPPSSFDHELEDDDVSVSSSGSDVLSISAAQDKAVADLRRRKKKVSRTTTEETVSYRGFSFLKCCKNTESHVVDEAHVVDEPTEEEIKRVRHKAALMASKQRQDYLTRKLTRQEHREKRKVANEERRKRRMYREQEESEVQKYNRVSEGILIYRLNTATREVTLVSGPSSNTDIENLCTRIVVHSAIPSSDRSRRGICLTGIDGSRCTLTACEQRTAIAWLESIDMMLSQQVSGRKTLHRQSSSAWASEDIDDSQREAIQESYLNLALYSNNLISAGAIPGGGEKKDDSGAGIYYSIESQRVAGDAIAEETLEAIAKRRAVIKDSWDFYRMICSLLRDRRKYDEVFRRMQLDSVYPYLNSMTGLNDPGDDGQDNAYKGITQKNLPKFNNMSRTQVCKEMVSQAEEALVSLVEICKALAGSLGMEEVGVGPVKEVSAAIRKAEKKYDGDVLKVTDYCRALLVVKDFPTLLALLELARDSFGPLIRRVKLSSLKSDHNPIPGGYRDCKINLELKEHICEIQVHVWPMWVVCGVDGFRHYRHCLEYSTDSFGDPYDSLDGLDRKTMAELIVMAEEAVADMPLDNIEWFHEKYILDYFAEVGLFLRHDLAIWAEITLRTLIKLRMESPDIGLDHHETRMLEKYLEQALRTQNKTVEADHLKEKQLAWKDDQEREKHEADKSLWESLFNDPWEAMDIIMDPNKKEREQEERQRKAVKMSKKQWIRVRKKRFKFLDADNDKRNHAQ